MKRKSSLKRKIFWFFVFLPVFVYANNSSFFVGQRQGDKPFLLAHRGLAQTFSMEGVTGDTNTAERIHEPEHPYLENTIPSMKAAFAAGADMVEIDVQLTGGGKFAVFHDHTLEYRTDGKGAIKDHTMAELKKLDVGYGYTADHGKTFPFRGKGIGLMPSLDEVLNCFPGRAFLIHIKNNDRQEGELLAQYLENLPKERLNLLAIYGGDEPIAVIKRRIPGLRVMSRATVKNALISYLAVGWTGYMPASMKNIFFYLPLKYARIMWGWPHRFVRRIKDAGSIFVLVAGSGEWSEGFDSAEDLEQIPPGYTGGIWTNRIDRIAPLLTSE